MNVQLRRRTHRIRRNRVLKHRANLVDVNIIRRCRLSRLMIIELCIKFQKRLARPNKRSDAIFVSLQIMVAFCNSFHATGRIQLINAEFCSLSRASPFIIRNVTQCLKTSCNWYISSPTHQASLFYAMQSFYEIANFPNVIGA